jgi:hypothetical protein
MTSRHTFLKAAAATVASQLFVLPFSFAEATAGGGPLKINYLVIQPDGSIIVTSAVAEVGQGGIPPPINGLQK